MSDLNMLIDLKCMYNLSSIDQSIHRRLHVWNTYLGTKFCNLQMNTKIVGKEKNYILYFCTKIMIVVQNISFPVFFLFWTDEAFLKSIPAQVWITSKPFEKNFQNQFVRRCLILTLVVYSSTSTSPRCFAKNKLQKKCEVAADEQPCWHFNFIPAASICHLPVYWLLCINEL